MVYKLVVLVGLGKNVECGDKSVEVKEWVELLKNKVEITKVHAESKIKAIIPIYPHIIKAFIIQSSKFKLSNGRNWKILSTWEGGKWT